MKDWTDLRILASIVRTGSLAAAGRDLEIHHVTVGRRLSALEAELGVKLVDRLPRQAVPTTAGVEISDLVGGIETIIDNIDRLGRADRSTVAGSVSISAPPLVATDLVAPSLPPLLAQYPELRIVIRSSATLASLARGEADIAVRLVEPDQPGLIVRRIAKVELGLYAIPEIAVLYPGLWRFIGYDDDLAHVPHHRWLEDFVGDRPIVLRSSDIYVQRAAALAGIGIAMLPVSMADQSTNLVCVDPDAKPPGRAAWLVVHPDLRRSAAVRVVLDHLATVLARAEAPETCAR